MRFKRMERNAKLNIVHEHFIALMPKAQRLLTKSLHTTFFHPFSSFSSFSPYMFAAQSLCNAWKWSKSEEDIFISLSLAFVFSVSPFYFLSFLSPENSVSRWISSNGSRYVCRQFIINTIYHHHDYYLFAFFYSGSSLAGAVFFAIHLF